MLAWLRWAAGIVWCFLAVFVTVIVAGIAFIPMLLLETRNDMDALKASGYHMGRRFLVARPGSINAASPDPRRHVSSFQGARRHMRVRRKAGQTSLPL